jgi:hypothetical protein
MNGEAISALALCVLPYASEEKVEDSLVQMLAGVLYLPSLEYSIIFRSFIGSSSVK